MIKSTAVFIAYCDKCKKKFKKYNIDTEKMELIKHVDIIKLLEELEDHNWMYINDTVYCPTCADKRMPDNIKT